MKATISKILCILGLSYSEAFAGVDSLSVLNSEGSLSNYIAIGVIVLMIIFGGLGSK